MITPGPERRPRNRDNPKAPAGGSTDGRLSQGRYAVRAISSRVTGWAKGRPWV